MTKKEKELKVLRAFDLEVGDTIKCGSVIYEIAEKENEYVRERGAR